MAVPKNAIFFLAGDWASEMFGAVASDSAPSPRAVLNDRRLNMVGLFRRGRQTSSTRERARDLVPQSLRTIQVAMNSQC